MLLAIDQGNQRTKCALFDGGALRETWSAPTVKDADAGQLAALLPEDRAGLHIGLCTVVPVLLPIWTQLAAMVALPLTVITGNSPTPLRNTYATLDTLGPDRLMAAVAAAHLVGTPVLPISLGTATVVDAVTADGVYLGGMIAPGIAIGIDGLARATSALPPASFTVPDSAIGHSSVESVEHGLFYHTLGGLRAMIAAVRTELGAEAPLALTGGWAQTLAPHLDGVALCDPLLVPRGIARTLAGRA